jgi:hypothetical protein
VTALSFDLDPVDVAVLALLRSPGNLSVQVGSPTDSDASTKTIGATLPYVLYASTLPWGSGPVRPGGLRPDATDFTATSVHSSFQGAKSVAVALRGLLDGHALDVAGIVRTIRLSDPESAVIVTRDPEWTRPDGGPLFYAVDRFHIF